MRTVEVFFVIIILLGAFVITTQFAVLPSPSQAFGTNLRELSQSTLETLDAQGTLSETIFKDYDDPAWGDLQKALSASLPPNIVYELSVYNLSTNPEGIVNYQLTNSISDASFGADSDAASLLVTSPNVTFTQDPQTVGESTGQNNTLYILNCEDANGWWITGYSPQTLALDLHSLLSPYFETTILVNSTSQFGNLLDGVPLAGENLEHGVLINTCGEAIPISSDYADDYSVQSYAQYCYVFGQKVNQHNWTYVSIVGYPLYYVSNTVKFEDSDNTWGIYGMKCVGSSGLNAFLEGLNDEYRTPPPTSFNYTGIAGTPPGGGVVEFTSLASDASNYYGVYPFPNQTATRALPDWILGLYDLTVQPNDYVFKPVGHWIAGATFTHSRGGAFTAIGLTRIPDIRITGLALLMHFNPAIYRSEFGASGTSRLVTLQLGQQGGTYT
jgi:hypothetical protein